MKKAIYSLSFVAILTLGSGCSHLKKCCKSHSEKDGHAKSCKDKKKSCKDGQCSLKKKDHKPK
jgi:hypothetical protein